MSDFSDRLAIKQVIVGAVSSISRADIDEALGSLATEVETSKARLAFSSFNVVRQRKASLWR